MASEGMTRSRSLSCCSSPSYALGSSSRNSSRSTSPGPLTPVDEPARSVSGRRRSSSQPPEPKFRSQLSRPEAGGAGLVRQEVEVGGGAVAKAEEQEGMGDEHFPSRFSPPPSGAFTADMMHAQFQGLSLDGYSDPHYQSRGMYGLPPLHAGKEGAVIPPYLVLAPSPSLSAAARPFYPPYEHYSQQPLYPYFTPPPPSSAFLPSSPPAPFVYPIPLPRSPTQPRPSALTSTVLPPLPRPEQQPLREGEAERAMKELEEQGHLRSTGIVKFFDAMKGFGFLIDKHHEYLGTDVFVHYTGIAVTEGFRCLCENEEVEYNLAKVTSTSASSSKFDDLPSSSTRPRYQALSVCGLNDHPLRGFAGLPLSVQQQLNKNPHSAGPKGGRRQQSPTSFPPLSLSLPTTSYHNYPPYPTYPPYESRSWEAGFLPPPHVPFSPSLVEQGRDTRGSY